MLGKPTFRTFPSMGPGQALRAFREDGFCCWRLSDCAGLTARAALDKAQQNRHKPGLREPG
jgi:hypothetical protein